MPVVVSTKSGASTPETSSSKVTVQATVAAFVGSSSSRVTVAKPGADRSTRYVSPDRLPSPEPSRGSSRDPRSSRRRRDRPEDAVGAGCDGDRVARAAFVDTGDRGAAGGASRGREIGRVDTRDVLAEGDRPAHRRRVRRARVRPLDRGDPGRCRVDEDVDGVGVLGSPRPEVRRDAVVVVVGLGGAVVARQEVVRLGGRPRAADGGPRRPTALSPIDGERDLGVGRAPRGRNRRPHDVRRAGDGARGRHRRACERADARSHRPAAGRRPVGDRGDREREHADRDCGDETEAARTTAACRLRPTAHDALALPLNDRVIVWRLQRFWFALKLPEPDPGARRERDRVAVRAGRDHERLRSCTRLEVREGVAPVRVARHGDAKAGDRDRDVVRVGDRGRDRRPDTHPDVAHVPGDGERHAGPGVHPGLGGLAVALSSGCRGRVGRGRRDARCLRLRPVLRPLRPVGGGRGRFLLRARVRRGRGPGDHGGLVRAAAVYPANEHERADGGEEEQQKEQREQPTPPPPISL